MASGCPSDLGNCRRGSLSLKRPLWFGAGYVSLLHFHHLLRALRADLLGGCRFGPVGGRGRRLESGRKVSSRGPSFLGSFTKGPVPVGQPTPAAASPSAGWGPLPPVTLRPEDGAPVCCCWPRVPQHLSLVSRNWVLYCKSSGQGSPLSPHLECDASFPAKC